MLVTEIRQSRRDYAAAILAMPQNLLDNAEKFYNKFIEAAQNVHFIDTDMQCLFVAQRKGKSVCLFHYLFAI